MSLRDYITSPALLAKLETPSEPWPELEDAYDDDAYGEGYAYAGEDA